MVEEPVLPANSTAFHVMRLIPLLLAICLPMAICHAERPRLTDVDATIVGAGHYLAGTVQADGMFVYRVHVDPQVKLTPKYNILRHGGTIYAMCDYHGLHPGDSLDDAIKRAGGYLKRDAIGKVTGWDDSLAVWSKPEVNRTREIPSAKLGGTGLGLVALLSIERHHPGFTTRDDLRKLGRFLVRMQNEDGSFSAQYVALLGGPTNQWPSLYYPGEAALGLLMLHEFDPDGGWNEPATRALLYLARSRADQIEVPVDHWALLATAKLFALEGDNLSAETRERLLTHTRQICRVILSEQLAGEDAGPLRGGYREDGAITATSIRLEGLLATLKFLPADDSLREPIQESIDRGIDFLIRVQIKSGSLRGAYTQAVLTDPEGENTNPLQRLVTGEVRIDYVQHALSALLEYRRQRLAGEER